MKAFLLATLVTLAATPFVFGETPAAAQPKAAPTNAPHADTLGFLETRDNSIEIKAGKQGAYTVRTKDGKVLAENISDAQLQAKFPQLHQIVDYGYARNTDASLNLNPTAWRVTHPADTTKAAPLVIRRTTGNADASTGVIRTATWNNDARQ